MLKNETNFGDFKKDVRLLLESFIRTNETMAAIADFNDDVFEGMLLLEETRTLQRIVVRLSPTDEACDLIAGTLKGVSGRCKNLGAEVMAYEADALIERLSHLQAAVSASV